MQATLVGGSLNATLVEVPDAHTPVRRFFRRDGLSWFECYEPAVAHRAGDGDLVFRFVLPPEERPPARDSIPRDAAERRACRDRRATPSPGRRGSVFA